ncbi:Protein kinase domain-containing protein [Streptomyces sp. DvalAA-14]|uniref:trypsin-like peptidase domain-containing protein n=1 Tax=unclassified Streptomyces TaxID=2593676 RepID=UPI00081BBF73|nr:MULTISPECIES: trypsin-like peptidase domain-containing protein [unclassified Streptomyces]MYS19506.1 trypsin-like serine protease [Streptomyces sp. SID4948]SCD46046.1 Protein kinase domain-containing protein [Streptomyces sp. DvalAA-14]
MGTHHHSDDPWRVRVDDGDGKPCGAGVLLDERHVLTCAHVVRYAGASPGGTAAHVRIKSVACTPEWTGTARVAPESWVHRSGTRRGDVALLRLDEPTGCRAHASLWRAPISGGKVRVYGFPAAEPYGIGTDAELAGSGGREGEWGLLNRIRTGSPWIEAGYSGAGVVALGGEFAGRVIGIVVADYVNAGARAAWMLPTETVLAYLPQVERYVAGGLANHLGASDDIPPDDVLSDALRLALTQELTRLLDGPWAGTVVLHCDVKPSNIIRFKEESAVGPRDRVRLIDFGSVRTVHDLGPVAEYTEAYAPPKHRAPRPDPEHARPTAGFDLFCLGMTLTELCREHLRDRTAPGVDSLHLLLERATDTADPERRFVSARQFAEQLSGVIRQVVTATPGRGPVQRASALFGSMTDPLHGGLGAVRPVGHWITAGPGADRVLTLSAPFSSPAPRDAAAGAARAAVRSRSPAGRRPGDRGARRVPGRAAAR